VYFYLTFTSYKLHKTRRQIEEFGLLACAKKGFRANATAVQISHTVAKNL